jgi:type IV pilus assembly protein PilE
MNVQHRNAFTLAELMIVIAILSIVAGLAVPSYFGTVEQTRANEARVNLDIIHMGQKIYRLNNNVFYAGSTNLAAINTALSTDMSAQFYTRVSVTGAANTYTARFTRNNTMGGAGSKWFQYAFTNGDPNGPTKTEGGAF